MLIPCLCSLVHNTTSSISYIQHKVKVFSPAPQHSNLLQRFVKSKHQNIIRKYCVLEWWDSLNCTGAIVLTAEVFPVPRDNLSISHTYPQCGLKPLNKYQEHAVRTALQNPFTLIQGPPGESWHSPLTNQFCWVLLIKVFRIKVDFILIY